MINKTPLELIKRAILEEAEKLGVKIEQIILFGSRARGVIARTVTGIY